MKTIYTFTFFILSFVCADHLHAQCFTDQNFTNMGTYSYTLPGSGTDTYIIEIECVGADGAPSLLNGTMPNQGGSGASMTAQYQLYGGNELTVFVGQAGLTGGNPAGGGGAGGSAVVVDAMGVLIAAAGGGGGGLGGASGVGGGGGASTNSPAQGGAAPGAAGGGGFNAAGANGVNSTGGGAGTLTSIGAGGMNGVVAGMGGMGWGGGGGGAGTVGGGGGGYQGGDGGANSPQGGQGGDSYVSTFYHSTLVSAIPGITGGGNQSNGSVLITCISVGGGNPSLVAMIDAITNPDCGGATNGSITASASGGVPPYEYSIDGTNFSSDNTFTGLGAGTYTITVMDADAETATADTTLVDPSPVSGTIVQVVDNACFGGMTGSIEVSGSGGAGGYMYSIDGVIFQSSGLFENLAANAYTVTIQDANGCVGMISATVGEATALMVNATEVDVLCNGESTGSILVVVAGGTSPYQYSLDGIIFQNDNIFSGLSAATYVVTVMDALGCIGEVAAFVEEPDLLVLTATGTNAGCGGQGGSIVANATGGVTPYIFTLDGTTTSTDGIFENLPADDYDVEVTDANGCSMMITVTVGLSSGDPVSLTLIEQGNLMCFGDGNGWITVMATGGTAPFIYSLDTAMNSNGVFNNLVADIYEISVTDSAGCMASISVELTQPDELLLNIDTLIHVRCATDTDGFAQFSASGGVPPYTFIVGDSMSSTGTFTNLGPGNHAITVRDAHLCAEVTTFMINILNPIEIFNYVTVDNICFGESNGSATVVIFGNSQYEVVLNADTMTAMNNDTITFNNLSAGQHEITATDLQGCSAILAITINEPDELLLSVANYIAPTDTTNGEITLSASGGVAPYEFSIDNGTTFQSSPTFSDLTLGNYEFTVRDANGCLKTLEYVISSISDIEYLSNRLLLAPNPTSDIINITSSENLDKIKLSIHNRLGQLIYSENIFKLHADAESIQINCHALSPGVYSMQLQTEQGNAFKQFVVVGK